MRAERTGPTTSTPVAVYMSDMQVEDGLALAPVIDAGSLITHITTGANTGEIVDAGLHE